MDSLNTILKRDAVALGLCEQWTREWDHSYDDFEFCEKFKKGMDFCIRHDYPSLDFIRRYCDVEAVSEFGVFVDSLGKMEGTVMPNDTYVCMGECEGTLTFPRWGCALVYVRHNSKVKIVAGEFAKISVRLYDNAEVELDGTDSTTFTVIDKR